MPTSSDVASGLALDIRNVSVRYTVPQQRIPTLKEFAIRWMRRQLAWREFCALTDVSLQVKQGEALAIVGRNGAGKSTLLKVIARVLRPREGTVQTHGRLVPLLELGAGFDPELSGRENVFLNGALLGHPHRYMAKRFDDIVQFAELEDFIDAPLRTYSTGMVARLGFAIATDVEPEILLLDEVLSVGDVGFQQKCTERMNGFRKQGVTFILVSHSLPTVRALCERAVWLEGGKVMADGKTAEVTTAFENHLRHEPVAEAEPVEASRTG